MEWIYLFYMNRIVLPFRYRLIALLTAFLIIMPCVLTAKGIVGTMGGINTVGATGPFDADRNPALLSLLGSDSSFGVMAEYVPYNNFDATIEGGFASSLDVGYSQSTRFIGGLYLAYAHRSDRWYFGVSLDESADNDQVLLTTTKLRLNGNTVMSGNPVTLNWETTTKNTGYNPSVSCSLAYRLNPADAIGFQLETGYLFDRADENSDAYIDTIPVTTTNHVEKKTLKTSQALTAEAGFGFLRTVSNGQIGLLLRSGEVAFERVKADYKYNSGSVSGFSDSGSVSNLARYRKGANIMAGAYRQITESFGAALEVGYVLPLSYKSRSFEFSDSSGPVLEKKTVLESSSAEWSYKFGVRYRPVDFLLLSTGVLYQYEKSRKYESTDTSSKSKRTNSESTLYGASFGSEYRFDAGTRFVLNAFLLRMSYNSEVDSEGSSGSSEPDTDARVIRIDLQAGMLRSF